VTFAAHTLALALLAAGDPVSASAIVQAPAAPARKAADVVDVVEKLNEQVPGQLDFRDAFGNHVELKEWFGKGKPILLTLVYFDCPLLCSLVLDGLTKGLNGSSMDVGRDYLGVTVSFNPKDDPRLAVRAQEKYLANLVSGRTARPQDWVFLTGSDENAKKLAESVGFQYAWDEESQTYAHPAVSFVLTPEGRISRYLYGVNFNPRDLRLALLEASQGRVGTALDRVILSCFKWDPAGRRYRPYVLGFIRAGALLVLAALATGLTVLWRRELKRGKVA
jgi:protein SCO1